MSKEEAKVITLKIGELAGIGWFGQEYITYAGMLSKETFSLGYGNTSALYNIYFPAVAKEITVKHVRFAVLKVTTEEIVLQKK
jgi:hypothetical protein